MAKIQKLTTEEARRQFADLLNGSQFRSEHTEITRHSKVAGVLVPGDWYAHATEAIAEVKALRKELAQRPAVAAEEPVPADPMVDMPPWLRKFPAIAAMSHDEARQRAARLEADRPEWFAENREACTAEPKWVDHAMLAADASDSAE